jgi:hypothetical protein
MDATKLPPEKLGALLEELETERKRRLDARIANGEVIQMPPIVVGDLTSIADMKAELVGKLRASGESREVVFGHSTFDDDGKEIDRPAVIITGVPRTERDRNYVAPPPDPPRAPYSPPPARDLMRRDASDAFDFPAESEPTRFRVTVEAPSEKSCGCIELGTWTTRGNQILVRDMEGRLFTGAFSPGDDLNYLARKILREKKGSNRFNDPIKYPSSSFH